MAATNITATANDSPAVRDRATLHHRWIGLLFLGIVQIVGGLVALAVPLAASLAAAIVFGAVLVVAGIFQGVHAFALRKWGGVLLHALGALLYIAVGLLMLVFPLTGALTLTLVVGALLIADGVMRAVLAYRFRPAPGWGWILGGGIVGLVLGVLLLLGWPLTGVLALGVLLGVNLLFAGAANCALAIGLGTHKLDSLEFAPGGPAGRA